MKSKTILPLPLVYTLLLVCFAFNVKADNQVNFIKGTWADAVTQSKQTGKPIFLDCYTTWCGPCKRMDKEAFVNKAVAKFYNNKFISIKVDMETEEGKLLKEKYNVQAYPTLLYIDGDEQLLHRGSGYRYGAPKSLIRIGKKALNPKKRSERLTVEYNKGNREAKFLRKYAKQISATYQNKPEVLDAYLKTLSEKKLTKKKTIKLIYECMTSCRSFAFQTLLKYNFLPEDYGYTYTILSSLINDNQLAIKTKSDSLYQQGIERGYQAIPQMQQEFLIFLTTPYYRQTNQLSILHDSIKNYVENSLLDSMTGKEFITEIRDRKTPLPYDPKKSETFYNYFNEDGSKHDLIVLDYNYTAWNLNEVCLPYINTITDTTALKEAKLWMEIALTIEEVPQYLSTYGFILNNLQMKTEALEVLNRLNVLLTEHPEYGSYDKAMKLREQLYKEKD